MRSVTPPFGARTGASCDVSFIRSAADHQAEATTTTRSFHDDVTQPSKVTTGLFDDDVTQPSEVTTTTRSLR